MCKKVVRFMFIALIAIPLFCWGGNSALSIGLQQQREVTGTVTDTAGTPLAGVNVSIKQRPSVGTSTDFNGKYILGISEGDVLVFSMVGFETREITLTNQSQVNVEMNEASSMLDDVVVVGFGKQKRSDMIGSVVSVKPQELKIPSSNLTTALAGRVAGMIAYQRSGEPGMDNA